MVKIIIIIMYIFSILVGKCNLGNVEEEKNQNEMQDINETIEITQNISQGNENTTELNSTIIQKNTETSIQKNDVKIDKEDSKTEKETNIIETPFNQKEEKSENQNTDIKTHPELAFTGYTQRNTAKENTVIAWIKDELSKQPDAVEFGFTVQSGIIAKENSTGFTMIESRVRNRAKNSIGGNYYVYVEEHYLYNSDGTEANITDTWVYVYTQY